MAVTLIDDLYSAASSAATTAGAAVVRIGRGPGRGSGVVTGPGVVVTNAHNLRGREATVTFADGRVAVATVAGVDADGDLAALAVDTGDITPIEIAADPLLDAGRPVLALSAMPGGGARISFGIVSGVGREFRGPGGRRVTDAVEHSAPLAPGSSGGPLLDVDGRAVALNTHRLEEGFYLARPLTTTLVARLHALGEGREERRPHLGIAITPPTAARRVRAAAGLEERDGVLIAAVEEGSRAAGAGLRTGDLLVAADGAALRGPDDLFDALAAPRASVVLRVLRPTGELDVTVELSDPATGDAPTV